MNQRGSFTVEAALVIPVVLLVLVAALEAITVITTHQQLVAAAREGARTAATVPDPTRAVNAVRSALPPGLADKVRVTVDRPQVVGATARVVVGYRLALSIPPLDRFEVPLSAVAVMRVER